MTYLVSTLQEVADQRVPEELMTLAMQNSRFRHSRQKHGGRRGGGGGGGRGRGRGSGESGGFRVRVRPGLGATKEVRRQQKVCNLYSSCMAARHESHCWHISVI